jgi:hypothetical protein
MRRDLILRAADKCRILSPQHIIIPGPIGHRYALKNLGGHSNNTKEFRPFCK